MKKRKTSRNNGGERPAVGAFHISQECWIRCHLPPDRLGDFLVLAERYYQLVLEGNHLTSLVADTSLQDFQCKHICDSLAILEAFPGLLTGPKRLADLGSGAGLPGIVLALALPELALAAIEPNHKKVEFLRLAMKELGIAYRCEVIARPGRELGHDPVFEGTQDIVVARAVASSDKLIRECRRLVKSGGCMVFYKTPATVEEELLLAQREATKHKLDVQVSSVIELPDAAGQRQFFLIRRD